MEVAPPFLIALLAHGVIGGSDVILNHEVIARLPARRSAVAEQRLHSGRELAFALIFFSLAWFEWHGVFAWAIVALFLAELCISTIDTVLEFDARVLPVTERVMHVMLFVNFGIVLALLAPVLVDWMQLSDGLVGVDYGWASWVLSVMALLSLGWSLRDAVSGLRQARTRKKGDERRGAHPPASA